MKAKIKQINGKWKLGYALDKHTLSSVYLGDDEYGHPRFQTTRTEVGEATYQLKYRQDWTQVTPLAECLAQTIYPLFKDVGFIVPMPASTIRNRQPVTEVARKLAEIVNIKFTDRILLKQKGQSLKGLATKEDKVKAIGNSFSLDRIIKNEGQWNVLIVDDLFHTGASMEAAYDQLQAYEKVNNIYVATLTWR